MPVLRSFEVCVDNVASRITNRERYFSPPLHCGAFGVPPHSVPYLPFMIYFDFGTDNVVVGLKQIRLKQAFSFKKLFIRVYILHPNTHPFNLDPDEAYIYWAGHPNSVTLTPRDGISLRDYAFEFVDEDEEFYPDTLGLYVELEYFPTTTMKTTVTTTTVVTTSVAGQGQGLGRSLEEKFIDDFVKLYEDARFSDLTIVVGEGDGQRSFKVHRCVLSTRSEYFRGLFESGMEDSRQDVLQYGDVNPDAFGHLLKFLYTIDYPRNLSFDEMRNLWEVADRFLASDLKECLEEVCIERLSSFGNVGNVGNMMKCLAFAREFDAQLQHLLEPCLLFLRGSLRLVRTTSEWRELERNQPELAALVLETDSSEKTATVSIAVVEPLLNRCK